MPGVSEVDNTRPVRALFDHCTNVFNQMMETAVPEETAVTVDIEGTVNTEIQVIPTGKYVWTGHTTQLFQQLGLSTPYYTAVMLRLKKMGCLEQIRRGGGNAQSQWRLLQPPTEELFERIHTKVERVTKNSSMTSLQQQVNDLVRRVNDLEGALEAFLTPVEEEEANDSTE